MPENIEIVKEDGWRRFILNRPNKRNALSLALLSELRDALTEADADDDVSAVLISANGPDFCAGYDVGGQAAEPNASDTATGGDLDITKMIAGLEAPRNILRSLWNFRKPAVGLVHGRCLAGGTELAGFCDMVIATEDASFAFPPVRDMGTPAVPMWLYYAGPQWARRLMFTGDNISGADAAKIGLVLKALPPDQAEAEAVGLMRRLAKIDWQLLAGQKRIQNAALELMGMQTLHKIAAMTDAITMTSPTARRLANTPRDQYVAALKSRREEVFGLGSVRVEGPDPFDETGRLV
jgi:enoyl-CoA hydratase